jgi:regulator of protease activity HflC (stomatin/prohibitin superfamily)
MPFAGLDILIIAIVVLAILLVFAGIKTVPQGMNFTVERFGRYTRTLEPGLNIIVPFIDRIGARLNMMEQVLDIPRQEVITRDNASVGADAVAFYQILNAAQAAYQVTGLEHAIMNLTMTNIRSVMGSMDLDELLSNRDDINDRLLRIVDNASNPWGIKMTRVEIKDIDPPTDLVNAMARQMKAERDRRAEVLEAEGSRNAQVLRAEGAKQAAILEAEGKREAAYREAEARERLAEAEARATQLVSDAIADGDVQAINYFVAQKYTEALAAIGTAKNQKVVLFPMEASALMGSLAGIGAIARETFGGNGPQAADEAVAAPPARRMERSAGAPSGRTRALPSQEDRTRQDAEAARPPVQETSFRNPFAPPAPSATTDGDAGPGGPDEPR